MKEIIKKIAAQQGWQLRNISALHGGDINQSFAIDTKEGRCFIKLNSAIRFPQMFAVEAAGLKVLQNRFPLKVPSVIDCGEINDQQFLILEWLQTSTHSTASWEGFGAALAQLHRTTNDTFGWESNNYLGSIRMQNNWNNNWTEFYANERILPLVKQLRDTGSFSDKDVKQTELFCRSLHNRIPQEPPALLHGDLWSGNASAITENGVVTTAIYDPSTFYGHREIDIALTRLFGGFPTKFYDAYHAAYPLANGWQQRLTVFQLSHLLLHAVLFGGGYVGQCREIINC